MSVIRVNKNDNYTVMSNYHLQDRRLSLKAKGLLSQMLSLPETWDYTVAGLVAINKESESAIKGALHELKDAGYLTVTKKMPDATDSGRIEYEYDIYELPKQEGKKQGVENQPLEIQQVENQGQLNTKDKILKTKELNNKRFVPPTLEEVQAYCKERQNKVDAERFIDYYTSNGWKVGKNNMKDWKATVRYWERNDKQKGKNGITLDSRTADVLDGIL